MEPKQKVVWLPGWFPCKVDALSGDFNERHAIAVSKYADVYLIFVARDKTSKNTFYFDEEKRNSLNIYRGYYKGGYGPLGKIVSFFQFYFLLFKLYKKVNDKHGPFIYVHVCVALRQSLLALYLSVFKRNKIIISEHNSWFIKGDDGFSKQSMLLKIMVKKLFKSAFVIHTVSNELSQAILKKQLVDMPPLVIPNVVDTHAFNFDQRSQPLNAFNFVTVVGDTYIKNADGIIRAFAKVKHNSRSNIVLQVIGPNYVELEKQAKQLKIDDSVFFYGSVPNTTVASIMKQCQALIFFSRFETFGCVMAEALCCGLPVIASNLPVLRENLTEYENAIFVESEDENELMQAMLNMTEKWTAFDCEAISKNAFQKYNYDVVGRRIANLYK
jgi:glycosyltransferase involved in cell wall biosynthesis